MPPIPGVFDLPAHLAAKADPDLIGSDQQHFTRLGLSLRSSIDELSERLAAERRAHAGEGQAALDRDLEVHRLSARLRTLRRYGLDLCLGRMVPDDGGEPIYVGRIGLTDGNGGRLLVDWRSPAAEPFYGATHGNPMGLRSRRRYRWARGRIADYWDEVFGLEGIESTASLDDQSAFLATLGGSRSTRMRDVLGTLQADQDAVIRTGSRGALVVDGGPGTGKTVVALHRAAYLLYSDPRLARGGGILFVGPHEPYLAYVADVLPSLGEETVRTCTLRDLVPEGASTGEEADSEVARLKSSATLVAAVGTAVRLHEQPPAQALTIETPWTDVQLTAAEWAEAFESAEPGSTHNDARDQVWEELVQILVDKFDEEGVPPTVLRRWLAQSEELTRAFTRAWPLLDPAGVVADLLSVPAYLSACAPQLSAGERRILLRPHPREWTTADLPLLDAARQRIGDPEAPARRRRRDAVLAAEREERARVVEHLLESDDSEMQVLSILRGEDARNSLDDDAVLPAPDPDLLAGPFGHVVVDEAQELTDAEWLMLLRRCPSRSFTIVGDRAQARRGFPESWGERLARVGLSDVSLASLTINYRTPEEVMAEAEPAIRAALPDANVPVSIRRSGIPVRYASPAQRDEILDGWLAEHPEGVACVIGDVSFSPRPRVSALTPQTAKGLEFDLVILVSPESFGEGIEGAVDRYVSMTRSTSELVLLSG